MSNLAEHYEYCYGYIEQGLVDVFHQYEGILTRLGVEFEWETLNTIVDNPQDIEGVFIAFIAWVLYQKEKGVVLKGDLDNLLIKALKNHWQPTPFQQAFLEKYRANNPLDPQQYYWQQAGLILGEKLRNHLLADITLNGDLIFQSHRLLSSHERNLLTQLKETIKLESKLLHSL